MAVVKLRWVVIETGSNQALIFQTNKQRLNVAASRLIWSVGFEWVPQAVRDLRDRSGAPISQVITASGLAVLLATPEAGREVIATVTKRALLEAPDLDIWGVVGDDDIATEVTDTGLITVIGTGLGTALARAQRASNRWRADRPSPASRDLNLPFTQTCTFTGRPAVGTVRDAEGNKLSVSAGVKSLWSESQSARQQLVDRLLEAVEDNTAAQAIESAVVNDKALREDGVAHKGWLGILHSDGNGIGQIFAHLRLVYDGEELTKRITGVSEALERCAWQVVSSALIDTAADIAVGGRPGRDWILPVLVGGDDITVVLDGRYAFGFAEKLTRHFEETLNNQQIITNTLGDIRTWQEQHNQKVTAPTRITLASGLVFVKPHHPFSHAVELTEDLIKSAKSVKTHEVSAIDVHVLHESAVRSLGAVREPLLIRDANAAETLKLWAGPIVMSDPVPPALESRGAPHLRRAMALISSDDEHRVPSGVQHILREVLTSAAVLDADNSAVARSHEVARHRPYEPALKELAEQHLRVPNEDFSRLITAMDLVDVARGTG